MYGKYESMLRTAIVSSSQNPSLSPEGDVRDTAYGTYLHYDERLLRTARLGIYSQANVLGLLAIIKTPSRCGSRKPSQPSESIDGFPVYCPFPSMWQVAGLLHDTATEPLNTEPFRSVFVHEFFSVVSNPIFFRFNTMKSPTKNVLSHCKSLSSALFSQLRSTTTLRKATGELSNGVS